jgi:hypothetical protein
MAVSLPSDLIVDVMRNADPARLQTAAEALQSLQPAGGDPQAFSAVLDQAGSTLPHNEVNRTPSHGFGDTSQDPHVQFERMVLRNLFESLLPGPDSGAFGTGPSAGVWRSLAADQLAGVYADAGGIGIASTLEHGAGVSKAAAQWPYFSTTKIEAFTG